MGWLWLDQALLAQAMLDQPTPPFEPAYLRGRIRACRYFAEVELPRVAPWLAPVLAKSDIVSAAPIEEF